MERGLVERSWVPARLLIRVDMFISIKMGTVTLNSGVRASFI